MEESLFSSAIYFNIILSKDWRVRVFLCRRYQCLLPTSRHLIRNEPPGLSRAGGDAESPKKVQDREGSDVAVRAAYHSRMAYHATRGVSADTALRLARYFATSPEFWLGSQADFDLRTAQAEIGRRLEKEIAPYPVAV